VKIEVKGWNCEGFRCPDMRVLLANGDALPRVALIQMPNGTGKTTTLNLLKATLTGEAKNWTPEKIAEFRRPGDARGVGTFEVELRVDGRPLTLGLELDFELQHASYSTRSPDVGGYNRDWTPPQGVRRFLTRKFVDLFIFDGELANRLLDPTESRAEAAIEALCQLDLLDDIRVQAQAFWEDRAQVVGGASTTKGLTRYRKIAERLRERLRQLRDELLQTEARLQNVNERKAFLSARVQQQLDADESNREARERAALAKTKVDEEVNAAVSDILGRMRRPEALSGAFTRTLRSMKANLDRAKLPESTSRQFFAELAEEKLCICGRPISEHERQVILARADEFLGDDLVSTLNSLKADIDRLTDGEAEDVLQNAAANLGTLRAQSHSLATELEQLEQLSFSKAKEDFSTVRAELIALDNEAIQLNERRDKLRGPATRGDSQLLTSSSDVAHTVSIKAAERQLETAEHEISRITGTMELRARIEVLKAVLTDAKARARQYIKEVLVSGCNARLNVVLRGDPIEIERIDSSLVLRGRASGSAGQNLAVGYTFLAEALSRGTHVFPLIVDSPAGPLDHPVRREVGAMVPNLCEQFIAFTISTEREGFLEPLERAANGDVKYLTAFRKTPGNADLMRDLPAGAMQTEQSVLVDGRAYFVRFAKESETDNGEAR
jgi:DNA sulfur modification protein DndD